jgi:hypothetical protein
VFTGHDRHVVATVAPTDAEYRPYAQLLQKKFPVSILNLPATQAVHARPSGLVYPTLHVQAAGAELAIGELEFTGQSVHTALPVAILYFPATQALHGPDPSGPKKPTLHTQAVRATLEIGELELAGHPIQVVAIVAPTVVENVPAEQSVQTALPVAILYLPATHAVHTPPSGPVNPTLQVQALRATLAIGEFEFVGHSVHCDSAIACVNCPYFPAPQSVQTALPVAILYFPATQAVHVPPAGPVNPALQAVLTQAALDVLAMGEVVPAGHAMHEALDIFPAPDRYPFNSDDAAAKTSFDR